jgi:hypothetical protein
VAENITYDKAYDAVDRDDFMTMLEVDRYSDRSDAFDSIISSTVDHFWDPLDPRYIDYENTPFDLTQDTILPPQMVVELQCAVGEKLDEGQKIRMVNQNARFMLSSILHGEQGALALSASLCHVLRDPGAQEYAANQTREEARHVTAFSKYIETRWGKPLKVGATLGSLMDDIVRSPLVYKKLIGMQMLIEGLAMGAFATLNMQTNDPLLRRMIQFVMSDEAFHHKFGKIWADRTVPQLTEQEHEEVELWAAECFQTLLFNLINAEQKQEIYHEFGLDWRWVRSAVLEAFTDGERRQSMTEGTNIFRVLIKTLLKAGIITERTRSVYGAWVDMDELAGEDDEVVGTDVAESAIIELREINGTRKRVGRGLRI